MRSFGSRYKLEIKPVLVTDAHTYAKTAPHKPITVLNDALKQLLYEEK